MADEASSGSAGMQHDRRGLTLVACSGAFAVAAALLILAPFRALITYHFGGSGSVYSLVDGFTSYSIDGWGRTHGVASTGVHSARFGIVLVAVGTLYAALAVAVLAARDSDDQSRRLQRRIAAIGIGVTGVLLGAVAAGAIEVDSILDGARVSFAVRSGTGRAGGGISTGIGWCAWLSIAALVLAACAVATVLSVSNADRQRDIRAPGSRQPGRRGR